MSHANARLTPAGRRLLFERLARLGPRTLMSIIGPEWRGRDQMGGPSPQTPTVMTQSTHRDAS